jgi:uncharacterized RDD family membrane protein YckC
MSYRDDSTVATAAPPVHWYYLVGPDKVGPRSLDEILALAQAGAIVSDTLVWAPGMDDWCRASTVEELKEPLRVLEYAGSVGAGAQAGFGEATGVPASSENHPWRRWLARVVDYAVAAFVLGFVLAFIAPETSIFDNNVTATLVVCAFWVIAEAFVQAWFGNTPGKALFAISVKQQDGRSLRVDQALARSLRVWLFGVGVGLPLVSLFTMAHSHGRLRRSGATSWDEKGNLVVSYNPLGAGRIVAIVLAVLLVIALAFVPA